ncbi:MAG TPA: hypothetical protein VGQ41_12295 [Pyrinomonadaceae bacterium]|jgi:hypothetical protein|nr:hypothetical protein [Pyrinomonadaceae bacterium]
MNRLFVCAFCFAVIFATGCNLHQRSTKTENTNQSTRTEAQQSPAAPSTQSKPVPAGELQPGQASGSYTAKGETVELKYAYAGRAERFGQQSLVILLTDKPIPPEALAEEIKSTPLLEGEKIRGLEYVMMDENSMWVRFHPSQYQESSSNKIKDYKVENDVVRGTDDDENNLSSGKYARSVKFVAAITK